MFQQPNSVRNGLRYATAQGPNEGDTATLSIYVTEGGAFDASDPAATNYGILDGTMTIEFADCTEGLVTYAIFSPGVSGETTIQPINNDNVPLCIVITAASTTQTAVDVMLLK